jgi:hypothetical protein
MKLHNAEFFKSWDTNLFNCLSQTWVFVFQPAVKHILCIAGMSKCHMLQIINSDLNTILLDVKWAKCWHGVAFLCLYF